MPPDPCPAYLLRFSFFPCLPPTEKLMFLTLVDMRADFVDYMVKDVFDAAWVTFGGTVDDLRYKNFIFVYYLHLEELTIGGVDVDVYKLLDPFWFEVLLANGCEAFSVIRPCPIIDYSRQG